MKFTKADLKAQKATKVADMRQLADAAGAGTLAEDDAKRFDALNIEVADLEKRIAMMDAADDAERRTGGRTIESNHDARTGTECRGFAPGARLPEGFDGEIWRTANGEAVPLLEKRHSIASFLPAQREPLGFGLTDLLRGYAFGPSNEAEKRAMTVGTASSGGVLVPTPLSAQVFDRLRARTVLLQAGARIVPMDATTLKIARITGDPTAAWRNEGAAITPADPTTDTVTLTARSLAAMIQVNRELLEDAPNAESVVTNVLAQAMAVQLDAAGLVGSGTPPTPQGIRGATGPTQVSMGTNGAAFTAWGPVLDLVRDLEIANAGTLTAMIAHPRTWRAVNGLVDTTNQPLLAPPRIADVPRLSTTSLPINETQGTSTDASTLFAGDFSEVLLGLRTDLRIQLLDQTYAANGQVGFLAWMRADWQLARPAAVGRLIGVR
jgi:HK97 family phage major capsid protein